MIRRFAVACLVEDMCAEYPLGYIFIFLYTSCSEPEIIFDGRKALHPCYISTGPLVGILILPPNLAYNHII